MIIRWCMGVTPLKIMLKDGKTSDQDQERSGRISSEKIMGLIVSARDQESFIFLRCHLDPARRLRQRLSLYCVRLLLMTPVPLLPTGMTGRLRWPPRMA